MRVSRPRVSREQEIKCRKRAAVECEKIAILRTRKSVRVVERQADLNSAGLAKNVFFVSVRKWVTFCYVTASKVYESYEEEGEGWG